MEEKKYPAWLSGYVQAGKMKPEDFEAQLADRFGHSCRFCHDPKFEPGECGKCKLKTCYSDCTYCDKCRSDICGNCDCGHLD